MFYVLPKEEFPKIREFIHYFRATAKTPFALEDMVENMIQGKKSAARKVKKVGDLDMSMEYGLLSVKRAASRMIDGLEVQRAGDVLMTVWQSDGERLFRELENDFIEELRELNGAMLFELPPENTRDDFSPVELNIHLDGNIKLTLPREKVSALLGDYSIVTMDYLKEILQKTPFTLSGAVCIDRQEVTRLEAFGIHGSPIYADVSEIQKK